MKNIFEQAYYLGINMRPDSILSFDDWWETHNSDIYREFLRQLNQAGFIVVKKDILKTYVDEIRNTVKELEGLEKNLIKK